MTGDTVALEISRLGAQGDGIADTPAGPVFVAGALPGEIVRVSIVGDRGRIVEITQQAPGRQAAVCRHFGTCGGCAAQHMADAVYLSWKRETVRTAFVHRGLQPEIMEVARIAPRSRRRVTLQAERRPNGIVLGFHEDASHTLVDIAECPVAVPAIEHALPSLRAIASVLLPGDGDAVRMIVTSASQGLDVALDGLEGSAGAVVRAKLGPLASAAGILRIMANGQILMQSAAPLVSLGGVLVAMPPGAFIQATVEAEAAIGSILGEALAKSKRVADLFCGLGTFTFGLARRARVLAIDGDRPAIDALKAAIPHVQGVKPIEAKARDLFTEPLGRKELEDCDAVVFDPPRAGARLQAEMVARSTVPVVVAISCNPATLARDARILVDGGYLLEQVTPIDQFVWSPHVEAVAVFRRASRGHARRG